MVKAPASVPLSVQKILLPSGSLARYVVTGPGAFFGVVKHRLGAGYQRRRFLRPDGPHREQQSAPIPQPTRQELSICLFGCQDLSLGS